MTSIHLIPPHALPYQNALVSGLQGLSIYDKVLYAQLHGDNNKLKSAILMVILFIFKVIKNVKNSLI